MTSKLVRRWLVKFMAAGLAPLLAFLVCFWGKSFSRRMRVINGEVEASRFAAGQGCVYVTWHQRLFNSYFLKNRRPISIMISRSRDGDLVADLAQRLGFTSVRGSSSRGGGQALQEMVAVMKRQPELCAGILADGPRGPARKLKAGALKIAQLTGVPIQPVVYSAARAKFFASWDRFLLPWPFSPIVVIFGEPVNVPPEITPSEFETLRLEVENTLNQLAAEADRIAGQN